MPKVTKEKFKTEHSVFDDFTNRTIFKLISEGHFEGLESTIALGKEANIFSAKKGAEKSKISGTTCDGNERVMVKIYRVNNCDFNKMFDYIKSDPRYAGLQGKKRSVIFHWVQREFRNLMRAREANVRVPMPITFKNNILVMELMGRGDQLAPMLKNKIPKDAKKFFNEIILGIKKLYKAELVHADLSAFNILNFEDKPVFIDFSQCSSLKDSRAEEYLSRDVRNVCNFFRKLGLKLDENKVIKGIKT